MKSTLAILFCLANLWMTAQERPYYYEIPEAPEHYTAASVAARMVDGLGFRYFWATQGLTEVDLSYKPSNDARTCFETLQHVKGLTDMILNAVQKKVNGGGVPTSTHFPELRESTLDNLKHASKILRQPDTNLDDLLIIFQRSGGHTEYPFWNVINGPVSDALWHVGQIVSFRRSSGNPLPAGVSVLTGTKRD